MLYEISPVLGIYFWGTRYTRGPREAGGSTQHPDAEDEEAGPTILGFCKLLSSVSAAEFLIGDRALDSTYVR